MEAILTSIANSVAAVANLLTGHAPAFTETAENIHKSLAASAAAQERIAHLEEARAEQQGI